MRLFRASGLQVATGIYGLLYLAFAVLALIPATRSLIIEPGRGSIVLELLFTQLLFLVFLVGFVASWRSRLLAGMILLLWYILVWCLEWWSARYGAGGDMGPVLALPGLMLGILFIVSWFHRRPPRS